MLHRTAFRVKGRRKRPTSRATHPTLPVPDRSVLGARQRKVSRLILEPKGPGGRLVLAGGGPGEAADLCRADAQGFQLFRGQRPELLHRVAVAAGAAPIANLLQHFRLHPLFDEANVAEGRPGVCEERHNDSGGGTQRAK